MEADLRVKEAEMRMSAQLEHLKTAQKAETDLIKAELDLLKHRENLEFKRE